MRASVRYPSWDQLAPHETSKFTIRYNTFTLRVNTASQADMHRKSLARPVAQAETHVEIDFDQCPAPEHISKPTCEPEHINLTPLQPTHSRLLSWLVPLTPLVIKLMVVSAPCWVRLVTHGIYREYSDYPGLNTWSVGLQCVCTTGFEYIGLQCAQWWTCMRKWCRICSLYMFSAATSANVSHPAEEGHNSHWHKPHTRSWFQFMVSVEARLKGPPSKAVGWLGLWARQQQRWRLHLTIGRHDCQTT